MIAYFEKLIPT